MLNNNSYFTTPILSTLCVYKVFIHSRTAALSIAHFYSSNIEKRINALSLSFHRASTIIQLTIVCPFHVSHANENSGVLKAHFGIPPFLSNFSSVKLFGFLRFLLFAKFGPFGHYHRFYSVADLVFCCSVSQRNHFYSTTELY